jgi:glucokinase
MALNENNKIKKYTIGLDVGGTKIAAVLYDGEKVIADDVLATPTDNLAHLLVMMVATVNPLLEKARELKVKVEGIGLSVAGAIDYQADKMLISPNLTIINNVKLGKELEKKIGYPVKMENDARSFVMAEALRGVGSNYSNIFGITLGTGIGGGWFNNKQIYHGSFGNAGEISRFVMEYGSGMELENTYQKLMKNNAELVADEAYRGDALAMKTYEEFGRLLGSAMSNIVNILDPEIIVIGGTVMDSKDLFMGQAKKVMQEHIESPESAKKVKVAKSKLGKNAGAIGAALLFG